MLVDIGGSSAEKREKKEKKDKRSSSKGEAAAADAVVAQYPESIVASGTQYQLLTYNHGTESVKLYLVSEVASRFSISSGIQLSTVKICHPFTWKAKWEGTKKRLYFVNLADKTLKAWKLPACDPMQFPDPPAPSAASSSTIASPTGGMVPQFGPHVVSAFSSFRSEYFPDEAGSIDDIGTIRNGVSLASQLNSVEEEETRQRSSMLSNPEHRNWAQLVVLATQAADDAKKRTSARLDAELASARSGVESDESACRMSSLVLIEVEERASLSAHFHAGEDHLNRRQLASIEMQKADARRRLEVAEHDDRNCISDEEHSEVAVLRMEFSDDIGSLARMERQFEEQRFFSEAIGCLFSTQDTAREAMSRNETQERMSLHAQEARESVALSLSKTMSQKEEEADTRAKELLLSSWVDDCFFTLIATMHDFSLQQARMYQEFIKCLVTGKAPAIRLEDVGFEPPSFLEEKWKTLERPKQGVHRSPPKRRLTLTDDSEVSKPYSPQTSSSGTNGRRPGLHDYRVEQWKSGLGDFVDRQRAAGYILDSPYLGDATATSLNYTTGLYQFGENTLSDSYVSATGGGSKSEHAQRRYEQRRSAALESNFPSPMIPFELAQRNREEMLNEAELFESTRLFPGVSTTGLSQANDIDGSYSVAGTTFKPSAYADPSSTGSTMRPGRTSTPPRDTLPAPPLDEVSTRAATKQQHELLQQDLLWDEFQCRGMLVTDNGLTARYFPRPSHHPSSSATSLGHQQPADCYARASLGVSCGEFVWEVRITKEAWTAASVHGSEQQHVATKNNFSWGGPMTPPAFVPKSTHSGKLMVGMASRLFSGRSSQAPGYFYIEDGFVTCAADGSDATPFGQPLFDAAPTIQNSIAAIVAVHLNFHRWELSFHVNGKPQGVAFRFTELPDPEPLFPVVMLAAEGESVTLQPPAVSLES